MSEYLKSLKPNDAPCYIKKLTLTTGKCLPDPYNLVAEEWEENINKFPDITWARYHRISHRNAKFIHKGINESI